MSKHIHIFSITGNYNGCTIYSGQYRSKEAVGTSRLSFNKGVPRRERYDAIANWLRKHGLNAPPYVPTKREVAR